MASFEYDPKKILVPIDFSNYSLEALRAAIDIVKNRNAKLSVLHVVPDPSPPYDYDYEPESTPFPYIPIQQFRDDLQKSAESKMKVMLAEVGHDVDIQSFIVMGNAAEEVLNFSETGQYDLVVMATHGRTGVQRFLVGSVTEQVIRHSQCPVLAIRFQEQDVSDGGKKTLSLAHYNPTKILVPVDFSEFSLEAVQAATSISMNRNAPVTALHVLEELHLIEFSDEGVMPYGLDEKFKEELRTESENRLARLAKEVNDGISIETRLVWGNAADQIVKLAESEHFELIVMSTHGRSGLGRFLLGSVAEQVIRHAPCPVLAVRAK